MTEVTNVKGELWIDLMDHCITTLPPIILGDPFRYKCERRP